MRAILVLTGALLLSLVALGESSADESGAVGGLPEGWTHDVLFANVCTSPIGMTRGPNGSMFVNDRCGNRILILSADGSLAEWTTTGSIGMDAIAYQMHAGRLIGSSGNVAYKITQTGTTKIAAFDGLGNTTSMIAHPETDHIFAVGFGEGQAIRHFDENLNLLESVRGVDNCMNIALDSERALLYYTESVARRVSVLDLLSGEAQVIRECIGNGWPDENVGVAIDDEGRVYYSSMTDGLFRYDPSLSNGSQETKLMDIPLGIGSIVWWSSQGVVLQSNVFAGTIVKMDPGKTQPELLEPNVNSPAIAAASDGTVYVYTEDQILGISDGTVEAIGPKLGAHFISMAMDSDDNLLVPIDRAICRVNLSDGSLQPHIEFADGNYITRIEYDAMHDEIVALTDYSAIEESVAIWRVSPSAGSTPQLLEIVTLEESEESYIAVNRRKGDVYFFNRRSNKLSWLDEEAGKLVSLFSQLDEPGGGVIGGFNFLSTLNGFVITYLDEGRYFLPLEGSSLSTFSLMVCGMDNSQGVEDCNGHYIATHAGRVYRIRPEEQAD